MKSIMTLIMPGIRPNTPLVNSLAEYSNNQCSLFLWIMKMNMKHATSTTREDDVDRLLRNFFHAQRPAVWPPAPLPLTHSPAEPAHPARSTTSRHPRYVLAISLAILFVSGWLLLDHPPSPYSPLTANPYGQPTTILPQTEASQPPALQHLRSKTVKLPSSSAPSVAKPSQPEDTLPNRPAIKLP
jgi:hypothetical protein